MFETLAESGDDEPFSMYGLLADDIRFADDGLSVTFHLHPQARFSNGDPVTADDVRHSYEVLTGRQAHGSSGSISPTSRVRWWSMPPRCASSSAAAITNCT